MKPFTCQLCYGTLYDAQQLADKRIICGACRRVGALAESGPITLTHFAWTPDRAWDDDARPCRIEAVPPLCFTLHACGETGGYRWVQAEEVRVEGFAPILPQFPRTGDVEIGAWTTRAALRAALQRRIGDMYWCYASYDTPPRRGVNLRLWKALQARLRVQVRERQNVS